VSTPLGPKRSFTWYARAARYSKMPMPAPITPGQLALATNDKTAPAALVEGLPRCELEVQLEHVGSNSWPYTHRALTMCSICLTCVRSWPASHRP